MASSDEENRRKFALALQRAIIEAHASISQSDSEASDHPPKHEVEVIEISDSEDDEDLKIAIALSLQTEDNASSPAKPASTGSSLLGFDRKAMEEARLARQEQQQSSKRKHTLSPIASSKVKIKKQTKTTSHLSPFDVEKLRDEAEAESAKEPAKNPSVEAPVPLGVCFPDGAIKRTWAFRYNRTGNDIRIEEVLQAETCTIAVISSFMYQDQWLFSKLDPTQMRQMWIMHGRGAAMRAELLKQQKEAQTPIVIRFAGPAHPPTTMHSKFMLLFHKTHVRIVITTANMIDTDWGETPRDSRGVMHQAAVMENSVFLIDLPRFQPEALRGQDDDNSGELDNGTDFRNQFIDYLKALDLPQSVIKGMRKFDFSKTGHLQFVQSTGGTTPRFDKPSGFWSLNGAVRNMKLDLSGDDDYIEIDYAASSIGSLDNHFLSDLYRAAGGSLASRLNISFQQLRKRIRLYYPLGDTVLRSNGGPRCGGTNFLTRGAFYKDEFPDECMRDYRSTRAMASNPARVGGLLSHNKLLFVRGVRKADGKRFAWVYVGSSNVSRAAWGELGVTRQGRPNPVEQIRCANWEAGVVVPVPEAKVASVPTLATGIPVMAVFRDTVEIPFVYPGEPYAGRAPWFATAM